MYPGPSIDVMLDIDPANIMECYLDTNYGFRYKAAGQGWKAVDMDNKWNEKIKAMKEHFKSDKEVWKRELVFANIPADPFTLVFEVITEKSSAIETLKLEDVYVGPK